ncbi:MAG: UvrD-helicase domain-containing protein [Phycisphaeraceae bacterium]|nr:UvrD-helicase domain-containing protein [Phycisphaeraceae bacterium]
MELPALDHDPAADALLEGLTEPQRRAVEHTEGPLLIIAGPGSGKTRVITRRIAHLIRMGIPPWQIMALTFTNKAAGEMRERALHLLGDDERFSRGLTVTTFHSLCARLLRRYADEAQLPGITGTYSIYDSGDQQSLMKRVIAAAGLSTTNWPPGAVLNRISDAKNKLQDAAAFAKGAHDFHARTIAKLYEGYEKALRAANAVDFDDLLMLTVKTLSTRPRIASEVRERWQYIMVDEYQDTNHAQFTLATLIAKREDGSTPNICVVGDPDQSIYGWRGADIANILEFEQQFPGCEVISLGQNFRSTPTILRVADVLIKHNTVRKDKDLFTDRKGGHKPEVVMCRDEHHESALVVDWFKSARESTEGTPGSGAPIEWKDCAVFYRTNALSRVMEDAFRGAGVPYVIARGTAFYEREEVKDALAYLRLLANPSDDVSLLRIVNKPTRGIGATSLARVQLLAEERGVPMLRALAMTEGLEGVSARASNAMREFVTMVENWSGQGSFLGAEVSGSLSELAARVLKESGLEEHYAKKSGETEEQREERAANLAELVSSAREFELEYDPGADAAAAPTETQSPPLLTMLRGYLESVSLVADADKVDPARGAVTLMTLHAAKGLEFRAVAMIGLEEGLLPHSRARESASELEEERRLAFVGVTRAMERLLITSAKYRTVRGMRDRTVPSQFLRELPEDGVVFSDQADTLGHEDADDFGERVAKTWGEPKMNAQFPTGCMVRHPRFGVGKVVAVTGGMDAKATVAFRDVGTKTLVLRYANLHRVD